MLFKGSETDRAAKFAPRALVFSLSPEYDGPAGPARRHLKRGSLMTKIKEFLAAATLEKLLPGIVTLVIGLLLVRLLLRLLDRSLERSRMERSAHPMIRSIIRILLYLILALLFKLVGPQKVMRFFPPIVTGPIIILIGLNLSGSAIANASTCWWLALVAIAIIVVANIWGKGMVKILPILIGVLVSYAVALVTGAVDFQKISEAAWLGIPLHKEAMGLFAIDGSP